MEFSEEQIKTVSKEIEREMKKSGYPLHTEALRLLLREHNKIAVALAYLDADQPHLAKLVLEGMEP